MLIDTIRVLYNYTITYNDWLNERHVELTWNRNDFSIHIYEYNLYFFRTTSVIEVCASQKNDLNQ